VNSKNRSKSPSIIIFDSLRIASKTRVAATLREFLQLEYDHKKTLPVGSLDRKLFNIDTIPTIEAAVPQQRNYSDCGLYVLQYIESYFAHRSTKINFQLSSTFSDGCEKNLMGSAKRKEILNVINQHIIPKEE
jgi:Ulp1 family protease